MTYLQLVQMLAEKCGAVAPTTVLNQTNEALRLVNWIGDAWNEVQSISTQWKWMRNDFSFQTIVDANKNAYPPTNDGLGGPYVGLTDHAAWHKDTFRLYRTSVGRAGEVFLKNWDYANWRDVWGFGVNATLLMRPIVWAERPRDLAIVFGAAPDAIYTVSGEYQRKPSIMTMDADVPGVVATSDRGLPDRFHRIIVYRAMMMYGAYEAAPEVRGEGQQNYSTMLSALKTAQLPQFSLGGPLA